MSIRTVSISVDDLPKPHRRSRMFGPFHRLESPTQTVEDAARQEQSGEVWRRAGRYELIPKVTAYDGPLPRNVRGVEFTTPVEPDLRDSAGKSELECRASRC